MHSYKVFLLLTIPVLILSLLHPVMAKDHELRKINECDVHHSACTTTLPGAIITLDISPKPVKAMKDLTFRVEVSGKQPISQPYMDLGMPGMRMGPNRVALEAAGEGKYEGKGIIVRCPSGRRTWYARVTLPGVGTVEFVYDVIY